MANPVCQSCGMPLSKDPQHGGTEADGTRSAKYCSLCYQAGQFTEPHLTADQMTEKVKQVMKTQMHMPGFLATLLARRTRNLERWRGR